MDLILDLIVYDRRCLARRLLPFALLGIIDGSILSVRVKPGKEIPGEKNTGRNQPSLSDHLQSV